MKTYYRLMQGNTLLYVYRITEEPNSVVFERYKGRRWVKDDTLFKAHFMPDIGEKRLLISGSPDRWTTQIDQRNSAPR
jgi:hypothetical protein